MPTSLSVGGREVEIHWDYRSALKILRILGDDRFPELARWYMATTAFYKAPVDFTPQAMEQLGAFLACGQEGEPGPRLMCWEHDAGLIISAVNQVAGREVRSENLHWWTFLSYFNAIGDSPFAQVVALREKLRTGKKLTAEERAFYRKNKQLVQLPDTPLVGQEKAQLEQLLKGGTDENNH